MTRQYDIDPWGPLRDLKRRIEILERATPLNNASIDGGSGVRVGIPAGVHVDPDASITAGEAQLSGAFGGRVGAGGTWISADGVVRSDSGTIGFEDRIDPLDGVNMTWNGARHTIEQVAGWLQGDINSVSDRTTTAQNTANSAASAASTAQNTASSAASAASAAQGTADTALSTANSKASTARVDAVNFKLNEVIDALNDLEAFVRSQHPSKPAYSPIVKG